VHEAIDNRAGIIINPAAYTRTSLALLDALKIFPGPMIELHISMFTSARHCITTLSFPRPQRR
jgi:3-dehydroquinate dehydratase